MSIDDLIYKALSETHADDMSIIRQYARWLKIRRRVNLVFYSLPAHWVKPASRRFHWLGR